MSEIEERRKRIEQQQEKIDRILHDLGLLEEATGRTVSTLHQVRLEVQRTQQLIEQETGRISNQLEEYQGGDPGSEQEERLEAIEEDLGNLGGSLQQLLREHNELREIASQASTRAQEALVASSQPRQQAQRAGSRWDFPPATILALAIALVALLLSLLR